MLEFALMLHYIKFFFTPKKDRRWGVYYPQTGHVSMTTVCQDDAEFHCFYANNAPARCAMRNQHGKAAVRRIK